MSANARMHRVGICALSLVLAVLVLGCLGGGRGRGGGGDAVDELGADGQATPPDSVYEMPTEGVCAGVGECLEVPWSLDGPRTAYWKLLLQRSPDGEVSILDLAAVDLLDEVGPPPANPSGDIVVEALDASDQPVDVHVARFPTVQYVHDFTSVRVEPLDGVAVTVPVYVRADPAIERFVLYDAALNELSRVERSALTEREASTMLTQGLGEATGCSHVEFLGPADAHQLAVRDQHWVIDPPPYHRALVQATLDGLPKLRCQSVGRVVFVYPPEGAAGWVSSARGDLVHLNLNFEGGDPPERLWAGNLVQESVLSRTMLIYAFTHETGHATHNLLDVLSPQPFVVGDWTSTQFLTAYELISKNRLRKGILAEFREIHERFLSFDLGARWLEDYDADIPLPAHWTSAETTENGFMSPYASNTVADDIAETATWPIVRGLFHSQGLSWSTAVGTMPIDYGCVELEQDDSVGLLNSNVLTKLHLVESLGMITPEQLLDCTGGLALPDDPSGFHVRAGGRDVIAESYDRGVTASIGTLGADRVFLMSGEGEASFGNGRFPALMSLRVHYGSADGDIDDVSWPRGIFRFPGTPDSSGNVLWLELEGAAAGTFFAYEGWILIVEASNSRIAGSVVVNKAFRPFAPIPVPEVYEPPLRIRFVLED